MQAAYWYWGNRNGLNFNATPPVPLITEKPANAFNDASTISSSTGQLLFYAQSDTVWNRMHEPMMNGVNMISPLFWSRNLICPKPKSNSNYFIIYAVGLIGYGSQSNIVYSEVDMNGANGLGEIVPQRKNVLLEPLCTFQLGLFRHANGVDYWLLVHKINSNIFLSFLIDSTGISSNGIVSSVGPVLDAIELGELKTAPNSKFFSFTRQVERKQYLGEFDNETGVVSSFKAVLALESYSYSLSFSPNSKYLWGAYLSTIPGIQPAETRGRLYQVNIENTDSIAIQNSFQIVDTIPYYQNISMQLGIDGKIYFCDLHPNSQHMGVIHCPDQPGRLAQVQDSAIFMGRPTGRGLPVLNQTLFVNARLLQATPDKDTICPGEAVRITAYGASAETFNWSLSAGGSSFADSNRITVRPTTTTTYYVRGAGRCSTKDTFVTIYVRPGPSAGVRKSWDICTDTALTIGPDTISGSFSWSNGATTPQITLPPPQGTTPIEQTLILTSALNTCAYSDTFTVKLRPIPPVPLPIQTKACAGTAFTLAVPNPQPGVTYQWLSRDSVLLASGLTYSDTARGADSLRFLLRVRNALGCTAPPGIATVSVLPLPSALSEGQIDVCSGNPFTITPTLPAGIRTVRWMATAPFSSQESVTYQGVAAPPGAYMLTTQVIDHAGCVSPASTYQIKVWQNPIINISGDSLIPSDRLQNTFTYNTTAAQSNLSYNWQARGGELSGVTSATATVQWGRGRIVRQLYITATSDKGCTGADSLRIRILPVLRIPNLITRNGDGQNEAFEVIGLEYHENYQIQIFNRWGRKVFTGAGDAAHNPNLWLPESNGLYYYLLTVDGNTYKGWVQVVK
jgi:gliding motility-associated-like protein